MNMSIASEDSEIFGSKAKHNMTPKVRHERMSQKTDDESKKVAKTLSSLRAINKGHADLGDIDKNSDDIDY